MDAMAFMFSVARENSSNVLEFNPECIMQEDLMSLSSKFPLIPGSQRSITFCTTSLSQKLRKMPGDADFDLTDPYNPPPRYNVLHDPHLKEYFQNQAMRRRLVEKGFITKSGYVRCTLLEFNMFRQWIRKLKLDRMHQEYRRERQMELQLWKERQAREQLLRDEELYSIVREREQKAREMKERGAKRREVERRKYLKLQEIDRRRREKFGEDMRQKKDLNESRREKNLAEKQVVKAKEEEKVKKIKIRLLVKRSSEDKKRESMLQKRRQTLIEEKERKLKENWKRRCSLSLARQEDKRKQEEEERLEHERNVARRTSIVAQQRRKSRVHHDMCLQRRRSTLEKQHQQAENFLEKIREKKLRDLERWKLKHARMRERHRYQGHRGSLQGKESDLGQQDRRRSRLSSVWDLESSLRSEFGIEDNVVYSGVVFAGKKTKRDARQSVQLEAVAEEGTYEETDESARFEKLWSRLEAELALRERVHYVVFGIISNAEEVLDQRQRQETYKKIPNYVQGIVNAAQDILANEQINDGDVRAKVRKYILQVVEDASLAVDDSGLLLSSDAKTRRKAREIVTNAINRAREDVTFRNTAKEVVAAAIRSAAQKSAQDVSKDLAECAKDVVAVAIISSTCYDKDAHEVIAARSLAADAANAAKASLERLYGVKCELVVDKQRDAREILASLDRCAKDVAAAAIISATRSLERVIDKDKCDVIAARTLATSALTAAKASLERLYSVKFEEEDEDQDYFKAVSKCLVKSAKDITQAVVSPAVSLLEKATGKDDLEDLTAKWLANDAMQAARASLEKLYGIKVDEKDQNEQAAKDIAAAAVLSAARSLQKDLISNDREFAMAARGLASNALDSAKASVDWIYSTTVATETEIEGKGHKMFQDLDQVAKDIAEVAVDSATRSLERIAEKHEWDLKVTTRELANDVINSAKASLERLYGIKCEPEEVPILASQETSESSLEYLIPSTKDSSESVKGHEQELWMAAQSLAKDAWKSATASLERLYNIADQMEDNIKHTALDISKTLMDSSGNLRQKLEREGLVVAARDLACNAIVSAAKAFPNLQEDETSLQEISASDAGLLNAAAKVSTVSARASLGELFDRGFIGGMELEEATGYLATHAMVSAENLLDTLQDETATLDLDLEICKAATELASRAVVSAEGSIARLVGEYHQTSNDRDSNNGILFWKVTTYVEGLINGALRHLGAEGYIVDVNDDQEEYEVLTHDQARSADAEYGTHVDDIYQREFLALRASRIVNDVVENAMEIVKTRMANESFFAGQSVADHGRPRNAQFARRRSSSVHFNEKSIFRSRRDSLSIANRPPTPRFIKGRAGSVVTQEIDELEKQLAIPSESEVTATNPSNNGLVRRRSSDPGPEFHFQDGASSRPEPSASDSKIDINEQGTSLNEKLSVYDIIKRREETASCEISPCESYVVLPQLNPSERSLIAARVESYEVLWKQRKSTPSLTSLPSLSPNGSFVANESVEQARSRKESKSRSVPSSSRLPDISSSTSKIYSNSSSASSLKGTSGHPKRTSSQKLKKSPKASPKTSRESVKLYTKPSTEKGLQSPHASVGKINVTSGTSLRKKEDGSRRSSSDNVTVVSTKGSVKDIPSSQRASNTKVVLSPGSSLTKATLSQRTSTKDATLSKGTASQNHIKSSPQSSKLFARASMEKTISSSRTSLGPASPRGSREKVVLTPRESTEKEVLSPRGSNQKVTSSPRTSREKVVLSSRTSKGNVTLSPRASSGDTALSPRVSKGIITQSPRASTENAAMSPSVSKGKATTENKDQSLRASIENVALSPRVSKQKVTQSPRTSTQNAASSPRVSKKVSTQSARASSENVALSPRVSKQKVIQSPRTSTENAALSPRVSKEISVQSARASSKNVALSPRASKGRISQSPHGSSENATLSSRVSKGNVMQSSHASTENVVLTTRSSNEKAMQSPSSPSKEKLTQSPRDSAGNIALSPRVSKGNVTQSPRASAEKIALSSRESKEKVEGPSSFSTKNTTPSSKSQEIVQSIASVLKDDSASSPSVEQPASLQRISLHKVSPSVTQSDQEVSALPKTSKTMGKTPSDQSVKPLDSQDTMKKTGSTEKSKTHFKTLSHSGEKLTQELASSAQTLEKAVELDRGSVSEEGAPSAPKPDVPLPQEAGSEGDRFDVNKDEAGGESIETKNLEINKSLKRADHSLERLILDKRLTPEGAEADTRPASSANVAPLRKHTDPSASHKIIPAQLESSECVKSSLTESPYSVSDSPRSSREKVTLKGSDVEEEVFTPRKKPEGEDQSELEGARSGAWNASSKKVVVNKGSVSQISDVMTKESQVQRPATNKKDTKDFEGYPTYRKVSVSRSIHDTVDDIVQRMLDTADEPNGGFEDSRPAGSGSREGMRRDSEINFDAPRGFGRERMLPTGKVSKTVMETVDFMVQSVSSSDERRPRQSSGRRFNGGIPRTASSMERFPRDATSSGQDLSCVYGVSPSPPTGPQPKLPSPKRSRLRTTSSQDSLGVRATQSDSSILSSSSDKAADLRPKVSGAWLDGAIVAGGDASVGSQSPKRPSSSPNSSQQRRSSEKLLVKNSFEGASLATDSSVGRMS